MNRKISLYKLLYYFIILYTLATMSQDLIPFLPLNRLCYFGILSCVVLILLPKPEKTPFVGLSLIAADMFLVHMSYGIKDNILDYIYFVSALIWLYFFEKKDRRDRLRSEFLKHRTTNKVVILICVMLVLVSLITKVGYRYAWEGSYYVGFSSLAHTAASSICLVASILLITYCTERFSWVIFLFLLLLSYGIFETGARTYIVPAIIIIYLYLNKCRGQKKMKYLLYAFGLAIAFVILSKSSIMDKFRFTSTANEYVKVDVLAQQTSGRSAFWIIDIKGFLDGSLFAKIFGHGHGYTYYLNKTFYNLNVWAHNDFIQLLVGGGLLTLAVYIKALWNTAKSIVKNHKAIDRIMLVTYIVFPAIFNGFYNYSHFFLSFIVLGLMFDNEQELDGADNSIE